MNFIVTKIKQAPTYDVASFIIYLIQCTHSAKSPNERLIKNFTDEPDKHLPISTDEYFKQTLALHNVEQSWEQQIN